MGEMADYYNDMLGTYIGPTTFAYKPKYVTCRYCGNKKCSWKQLDGKWKLFELHLIDYTKDKLHVCPMKK